MMLDAYNVIKINKKKYIYLQQSASNLITFMSASAPKRTKVILKLIKLELNSMHPGVNLDKIRILRYTQREKS